MEMWDVCKTESGMRMGGRSPRTKSLSLLGLTAKIKCVENVLISLISDLLPTGSSRLYDFWSAAGTGLAPTHLGWLGTALRAQIGPHLFQIIKNKY